MEFLLSPIVRYLTEFLFYVNWFLYIKFLPALHRVYKIPKLILLVNLI